MKSKILNQLSSEPYNIVVALDISSSSTGISLLQYDDNKEIKGFMLGIINITNELIDTYEDIVSSEPFMAIIGAIKSSLEGEKKIQIKTERFNQVAGSRGQGATEKISVARYLFRLAFNKILGGSWSMWDEENNIATNSLNSALKKYYDGNITDGELKFSQILKNDKENKKWRRIVAMDKFFGGKLIPLKLFTLKEKEDIADAFGICLYVISK